jgi:hypothetical protein
VIPATLFLAGLVLFAVAAERHRRRRTARPLAWAAITCWGGAYLFAAAVAFGVVRA